MRYVALFVQFLIKATLREAAWITVQTAKDGLDRRERYRRGSDKDLPKVESVLTFDGPVGFEAYTQEDQLGY